MGGMATAARLSQKGATVYKSLKLAIATAESAALNGSMAITPLIPAHHF